MKIKMCEIPIMTIEQFAEAHDLTMVVTERRVGTGDPCRYYACFESCEVMVDGCLRGDYGNGPTPERAISDYASKLQLQRVAIGAYTKHRREIDVPRLVEQAPHRPQGA